jgi:hypothetical protein
MTATLRREMQVTEKVINHVPSALPADHDFECEVVSIESPEIKRFSVNMNKKHWTGMCGKVVKLPGKAINVLYDAVIEEPEYEVNSLGVPVATGNIIRRSRWSVRIIRDLTADQKIEASHPVDGIVLDKKKIERKEQLEQMTVVELRKLASSLGVNSNAVKFMNHKDLVAIIQAYE